MRRIDVKTSLTVVLCATLWLDDGGSGAGRMRHNIERLRAPLRQDYSPSFEVMAPSRLSSTSHRLTITITLHRLANYHISLAKSISLLHLLGIVTREMLQFPSQKEINIALQLNKTENVFWVQCNKQSIRR